MSHGGDVVVNKRACPRRIYIIRARVRKRGAAAICKLRESDEKEKKKADLPSFFSHALRTDRSLVSGSGR